MPSGAIIFRMGLFFIFLALLFLIATWVIQKLFGVQFRYWSRIWGLNEQKAEEHYERKFQMEAQRYTQTQEGGNIGKKKSNKK